VAATPPTQEPTPASTVETFLMPVAYLCGPQVACHTHKLFFHLQMNTHGRVWTFGTSLSLNTWRCRDEYHRFYWSCFICNSALHLGDPRSTSNAHSTPLRYTVRRSEACRSFANHKCPPITSLIQGYFATISHTLTSLYPQHRRSTTLEFHVNIQVLMLRPRYLQALDGHAI
jgi:hypothetical protein